MFKELFQSIEQARWQTFEVNGIPMRVVEIVMGKAKFLGILEPSNDIFIPMNSRSHSPVLEKIKEKNKKNIGESYGERPVEQAALMLQIPQYVNRRGLYTGGDNRFHSTGILLALTDSEKISVNGLFARIHEIYPQLTLSRSNPPR